MEYLNFDIKISGGRDSGYILNLAECPVQLQKSLQEPLHPPFTAIEVSERLAKLAIIKSPQPILPFPRAEREQELRKFGTALYRALFAGQIGVMYRKCLGLLREHDVGLLIRLQIEPPELRTIPWEYAYGDHLEGPSFLTLSPLTPIVRYLDKRKDFKTDDLSSILVLAANPTRDKPNLDFAREKTTSLRICGEHELEADGYEQVDLAHLQAHLTRHHTAILHFIGHGEQKDGQGCLYLEDVSSTAQQISADAFWEILRHNRKLRLVVLSACQSESIAHWMVSNGLTASVAIQFEISDKASIVFFEAFYASLLAGRSLALAMYNGRQAVRLSLGQVRPGELAYGLQWGLPVVYMAGNDSEARFEPPPLRQETSLGDVVLKVRYGLEHLKLSGTPVNIAILPDLVFDFLHEIEFEGLHKRRKMERERGSFRDIGGHAGIGAKTLATLQDRDDGTYDVQCIIKTGEIGRAVLDEYLIRYANQRGVLAPDLCHVMTHGQSREQVFNMFGEAVVRQQVALDPKRDMCLNDLRNHPTRPLDSIQTANVTGWLTTKSRIFSELMRSLQSGELELSGRLFVNVSVYSNGSDADDRNRDIFDILVNTQVGGRSPIDVLSIGEKEAIALARVAFVDKEFEEDDAFQAALVLHEQLGMTILYHTWQYVVLFREGTATAVPTFHIENPCLHNGAGDTLNAGAMLAMAVRDALELCHRPAPPEFKLSLEECVLFGIAVVSCRLTNGEYPTQDDLLAFVTENYRLLHAKEPIPPGQSGDQAVPVLPVADREEYHYRDLPALFAGLSSQHPLLARLLAVSKLGQYHQPEVVTALREMLEDDNELVGAAAIQARRRMPRELLPDLEVERRVILVDLDNTLWHARASRMEGSRWSIRRLKHEINLLLLDRDIVYDVDLYRRWQVCEIADVPDEQLVQLYEADVYASGLMFEIMGYPNFRRLWNTPESYAVLLALAQASGDRAEEDCVEKQSVLDKLCQARERVTEIDRRDLDEEKKRRQIKKVVRELEGDKDIIQLKELLEQIAMDPLLGDPINSAVDEFELAPIRPFADARDFLRALVEVGSFEIYGVTGGPAGEEWERTKRFGLGDLIAPERLLSTQSAARPRADLETLEHALQEVEKRIEDVRSEKSRLEEDVALYNDLLEVCVEQEVIDEKRGELTERIKELDKELLLLDQQLAPMVYVRDLFERFLYKRGRPFYARCVHAVHQGQSNPRDFLNSFSPTERVDWERGVPTKLAVVGDRYDDDLRPLIQIYGDNVCTVRVLTGHHRIRHTNQELDKLGWPKPTYQVETLAQARNLLVKPSLWDKLVPVSQPPIFEETVDAKSVGNLLQAFGMQPDVLAKVAKSVIDENARDDKRIENLLRALESHLEAELQDTVSRRRAIEILGMVGTHPLIIDRVYELLLDQLCQSQDATIRDSVLFALASTLPPGDNRWADVEQHTTILEKERLRRLRGVLSRQA
jgi:FMN phosphatase YigB (HAD superfamily)